MSGGGGPARRRHGGGIARIEYAGGECAGDGFRPCPAAAAAAGAARAGGPLQPVCACVCVCVICRLICGSGGGGSCWSGWSGRPAGGSRRRRSRPPCGCLTSARSRHPHRFMSSIDLCHTAVPQRCLLRRRSALPHPQCGAQGRPAGASTRSRRQHRSFALPIAGAATAA